MDSISKAYMIMYVAALICLAVGILFALVRAIKGPRLADRIVGINMIGTLANIVIAILSKLMGESYLLDVCLIYCLISFLAVVILSKIYIAVYREHHKNGGKDGTENDSI